MCHRRGPKLYSKDPNSADRLEWNIRSWALRSRYDNTIEIRLHSIKALRSGLQWNAAANKVYGSSCVDTVQRPYDRRFLCLSVERSHTPAIVPQVALRLSSVMLIEQLTSTSAASRDRLMCYLNWPSLSAQRSSESSAKKVHSNASMSSEQDSAIVMGSPVPLIPSRVRVDIS